MKKIKSALIIMLAAFSLQQVNAQRFLTPVFTDAEVAVTNNVQYAQNYDFLTDPAGVVSSQFMRVYQPDQSVDTETGRPVVVYLHTGNFLPPGINGSPTGSINDSTVVEICSQYAKKGFVVVSPSYRLGWNPLSTDAEIRKGTLLQAVYRAIQDVRATVRFLRKSVAEQGNPYKIDPDRIVIFGEGTGGYVALATATLDRYEKLLIAKFLDQSQNPPAPYVDSVVMGNTEGFGGTKNIDNHAGYSSKINMVLNIGGALADTIWMEAGQPPMVTIQCVRDPFAPYTFGTVIVPTTNENVVDVFGGGLFIDKAVRLGNNCAFDDATEFTDVYSTAARARYNTTIPYIFPAPNDNVNVGGGEGLFPVIRPLGSQILYNEASPWQWWNTSHPNSASSLNSNPDMSKAKALAYIDTIQGYTLPRIYKVLNLSDLSEEPNRCNETTSVFNTFKQASSVSIYPNPSNNRFFVELSGSDRFISKVQLMDITGKVVYTQNVNNASRMMIVENNFSSGVYFANIHLDNGQQATRKVIIE